MSRTSWRVGRAGARLGQRMNRSTDEDGAETESKASRWAHARAAFVLFHLTAVFVLSIPASGGMRDRSAWQAPHIQRDLEVWTQRANALGWDMSPPEFEAWLWDFAQSYLRVRDQVAAPFARYASYTGAFQGWSMFANPQTEPAWLVVEVREAGAWRVVYRERSDEHDWMSHQLDHNRVRKLQGRLARGAYEDHYLGLAQWLARHAAADFPEATALRTRVERRRTLEPGEASEARYREPRWERELILPLEPLR